jgi:hypothetical protein
MANLIQNYAEFSVEAVARFTIKKVVFTHDDQIIKICEVQPLDDLGQFKKLKQSNDRDKLITQVKD